MTGPKGYQTPPSNPHSQKKNNLEKQKGKIENEKS